jgi:hypothetical protein
MVGGLAAVVSRTVAGAVAGVVGPVSMVVLFAGVLVVLALVESPVPADHGADGTATAPTADD